jgi:hypothetical protein
MRSVQLNAQLREHVVNGGANAARAAVPGEAETICASLQQALQLACSVSAIQFYAGPMGTTYRIPRAAGDFVFGNANFRLGPGR